MNFAPEGGELIDSLRFVFARLPARSVQREAHDSTPFKYCV